MKTETTHVSARRLPSVTDDAAPARRQGKTAARLLASLRFDGLFWRKFARFGAVYAPQWWKRLSPPVVALIIYAVATRNRRGALRNQRRILGPDATASRVQLAAYRMFATFARCMTETMEFYGPRPGRFQVDQPERNPVTEALALGRGVILATAHVGNWDVSARALQSAGRPVNMVMAREPNETAQEYVRSAHEHAGVKVILSDSSVFSAFNMIRALRRNEVLAIQIDRVAAGPSAPGGVRVLPFLGENALFHEGPFHLARLSGSPVIPVFTLRRGLRHYEIVLGDSRFVSRNARGDAEKALRETVALLEDTIRRNPEQWFQFE